MCNANNFIPSVKTSASVVKNHLKREKKLDKKFHFFPLPPPPPPDTPRIRIQMKIFAQIQIRKKKKCGSETLLSLLLSEHLFIMQYT